MKSYEINYSKVANIKTRKTTRNGKSAERRNKDSLVSSSKLITATSDKISSLTILELQKIVGHRAVSRLISHSVRSNTNNVNSSIIQRCGIGCKGKEGNDEQSLPIQLNPIEKVVPVAYSGWLQRQRKNRPGVGPR